MTKNILNFIKNFFHKNEKFSQTDIDEFDKLEKKPLLFVKGLSKKYFGRKNNAIDDISFNVFPGEFHAFIGANGAGKTTTIKSIIGAYSKWNGTILINGIPNNKESAKFKIGYIPENARFPEKFSALKYLEWMILLTGLNEKDSTKLAEEKLKEFDMWELRNKSPNTFSSGQKKKILLAQALVHNPDLLIMDEPVANLDPKARNDFFKLLDKLRKDGKAIFISSHVLAELQTYFDSCTILDGGKIVFSGSKDELIKKFPTDSYTLKSNETDTTKLKKVLTKTKVKYEYDEFNKNFRLSITKNDKIEKIQELIIKNKIFINYFSKNELTLEQAYEKMVVNGSVDTMKK